MHKVCPALPYLFPQGSCFQRRKQRPEKQVVFLDSALAIAWLAHTVPPSPRAGTAEPFVTTLLPGLKNSGGGEGSEQGGGFTEWPRGNLELS